MSKSETDAANMQTVKLRASANYIGKPEFLHEGKLVERTLKISKVSLVKQDWHGKTDPPDIVIAFAKASKRLIANKTNQRAIAKIHGDGEVTEVWVGKAVTLFWTKHEPIGGKEIRNPSGGEPGGVRVKG